MKEQRNTARGMLLIISIGVLLAAVGCKDETLSNQVRPQPNRYKQGGQGGPPPGVEGSATKGGSKTGE